MLRHHFDMIHFFSSFWFTIFFFFFTKISLLHLLSIIVSNIFLFSHCRIIALSGFCFVNLSSPTLSPTLKNTKCYFLFVILYQVGIPFKLFISPFYVLLYKLMMTFYVLTQHYAVFGKYFSIKTLLYHI